MRTPNRVYVFFRTAKLVHRAEEHRKARRRAVWPGHRLPALTKRHIGGNRRRVRARTSWSRCSDVASNGPAESTVDRGGDHRADASGGVGPEAMGLPGVIIVLWRAGRRIREALALAETDLYRQRGAVENPARH